jgi:hypothetical protein
MGATRDDLHDSAEGRISLALELKSVFEDSHHEVSPLVKADDFGARSREPGDSSLGDREVIPEALEGTSPKGHPDLGLGQEFLQALLGTCR